MNESDYCTLKSLRQQIGIALAVLESTEIRCSDVGLAGMIDETRRDIDNQVLSHDDKTNYLYVAMAFSETSRLLMRLVCYLLSPGIEIPDKTFQELVQVAIWAEERAVEVFLRHGQQAEAQESLETVYRLQDILAALKNNQKSSILALIKALEDHAN